MEKGTRYNWLISPASFIRFIGVEYELLKRSGSKALFKFYLASLLILFILGISIFSIFYAMELLFHMIHVEIILSLFFSGLFVFIYVYLLHTFSKESGEGEKGKDWKRKLASIGLSEWIRTLFVVFMGFIIAQPIAAFVLRGKVEHRTQEYRQKLIQNYSQKLDFLYSRDQRLIKAELEHLTNDFSDFENGQIKDRIIFLQGEQAKLASRQSASLNNASSLVKRTDFLFYRIKEISRMPVTWGITLMVIFLFLLPGMLVYFISHDDVYYRLKRKSEEDIILGSYSEFLEVYSTIMFYQCGRPIRFYSAFADPPFNTIPLRGPDYRPEEDFFKRFSQ